MTSKGEQATRMKTAGLSNRQIAIAMDMPEASVRRLRSEYRAQAKEALSTLDADADKMGSEIAGEIRTQWNRPIGEAVRDAEETMERVMPGVVGTFYEMRAGQTYGTLGEAPRERDKPRRHIIIPDTQVKQGVPTEHLLWAGKYIREQRPDVVVHLGDHWDLPSLSSYEARGSKYFEGQRIREDIDAGNRGLELIMEGMGDFRPERMVLLRGNHEDRMTRFLNAEPRMLGVFGFEDFNDTALGWEVSPFLRPINVDSLWYAHYWSNNMTGRAYGGTVENVLKTLGHSFTQGHRQGLFFARRELSIGGAHVGLVAGSFYQHDEDYKGYQGNNHWRGIIVKNEVQNGDYDIVTVSLDYLRRKFS